MFNVSACIWSLPQSPLQAIATARTAGFDLVDLRPDCWEGIKDRSHLSSQGVRVACCGITPVTMAPGLTLDTLATDDAGRALPYFIGAIQRSAALGAGWVYMVTPNSRVGETGEYLRSIARLASEAKSAGVKLCVEPHPGRALGNYGEVMRFLDTASSDNLFALLDLGHIKIGGEEIGQTVTTLGDRIGYVHIDDNDGRSDRHFGLLEGVLKPSELDLFFNALARAGYSGPVALELNKSLPAPVSSLVSSRDFIFRWAERRAFH